jgi:hypothetical protein
VIEQVWVELFSKARIHGHFSGQCSTFHDEAFYSLIDASGPRDEALKLIQNRLFIGITQFCSKRSLVGSYRSLEELRVLIHSTLHVPLYCAMIERAPGIGVSIDGGYGNALGPSFDRGLVKRPLNDTIKMFQLSEASAGLNRSSQGK